jgi:hypothetical protein
LDEVEGFFDDFDYGAGREYNTRQFRESAFGRSPAPRPAMRQEVFVEPRPAMRQEVFVEEGPARYQESAPIYREAVRDPTYSRSFDQGYRVYEQPRRVSEVIYEPVDRFTEPVIVASPPYQSRRSTPSSVPVRRVFQEEIHQSYPSAKIVYSSPYNYNQYPNEPAQSSRLRHEYKEYDWDHPRARKGPPVVHSPIATAAIPLQIEAPPPKSRQQAKTKVSQMSKKSCKKEVIQEEEEEEDDQQPLRKRFGMSSRVAVSKPVVSSTIASRKSRTNESVDSLPLIEEKYREDDHTADAAPSGSVYVVEKVVVVEPEDEKVERVIEVVERTKESSVVHEPIEAAKSAPIITSDEYPAPDDIAAKIQAVPKKPIEKCVEKVVEVEDTPLADMNLFEESFNDNYEDDAPESYPIPDSPVAHVPEVIHTTGDEVDDEDIVVKKKVFEAPLINREEGNQKNLKKRVPNLKRNTRKNPYL